MKKITILLGLLLIATISLCDTHIPAGDVSGIWTIGGSPYIIDGEINIPVDSTLTIEPSVQVIFSGHYKFYIYGRLLAEGTALDTIVFTAQDATIGWWGLRFFDTNTNGQDSSKVVYCKLECGKATGSGNDRYGGAIYFNNSSDILIKNCLITKNYAYSKGGGIHCYISSPSLINVTITDNSAYQKGGGIFCSNSDPSFVDITLTRNLASLNAGGGIFCEESSPSLENVIISENTAGIKGGGICCWSNSNPSLTNVTISGNTATGWAGGGIFFYDNSSVLFNPENRCNIFFNSAPSGTDLFADWNCPIINVFVDTFTVLEPNDYFAYPVDNFTFDILNEKLEPVNEDLYVSPTGSNDNTGLSPDDPLLTIYYALLKIVASSGDPHTIYLANGTYPPSQTGEIYPLICKNYVFLQGEDQDSTILDGEGLNRILHCPYEYSSIEIENMTIKNGNARNGGAIYCDSYSSPSFNNITISENYASNRGGGIYCNESGGAVSLTNVTICGNTAYKGGGISNGFGYPSSISLSNVTIKENNATYGGGIYWEGEDLNFDPVNRCNIYLNSAANDIGNDLYVQYAYYGIEVIVDTFTVLYPCNYHAFPIEDFTFDILHAYAGNLINADLYVAVDGDNSNSGTTPDDPFRTIQYALSRIYADSLNPHSIFVSAGVYSSSTNEEYFPINHMSNFVSVIGAEDGETILDAEHQSSVLAINHLTESTIRNLTITNGTATNGGGIFLKNSSPTFEKITVTNNSANSYGGGIFCYKNSNPEFINVTISGNSANYKGGGIYASSDCNISLENCILWNDTPQEIYIYSGSVTATYSDIQDGWTGTGNIDADPLFADPANGDFHLTWANFPIPDSTMSPCIDAGDPASPLDPDSTRADMGAFYFDQNQQGVEEMQILPRRCLLYQNYPNPFSPRFNRGSTTISFNLTTKSHKQTLINIYNIKGQLVRTIYPMINDQCPMTTIEWDGKDEKDNQVSSGIYFYQLQIDNKIIDTKKCIFLK